jgi:hypothetical protein
MVVMLIFLIYFLMSFLGPIPHGPWR